jgi:alcohol dehydrogenase (NADP+)
MKENLDAIKVSLTEGDMQEIARIDRNRRYIDGEVWVVEGGSYSIANIWDE